MRWSPLGSIFVILAVASVFEGVFAAPLDVVLEKRASRLVKSLRKVSQENKKKYDADALESSPIYQVTGEGVEKLDPTAIQGGLKLGEGVLKGKQLGM